MVAPHHIVHLVMKLGAEAVRTRVNSGASPHHRIVSAKSENTVPLAAPLASVGQGHVVGTRSGQHAKEGLPVAHHRFFSRTLKNDPVMW